MEFSTKAVEAMAEIMVAEMKQVGKEGGDIRTVETGMPAILRVVGAKVLEHAGRNKGRSSPPKRAPLGSAELGMFWLPCVLHSPWPSNIF